jgi:hypothetical protein
VQERLERRQSLQTIAWFNDLYKRDLLDLDPPYQRRSVWNVTFRQYFIETVLLHYPAPAIFLYEDISTDGSALYSVVDGKQRLTTIFDFANGDFAVADDSVLERYQGKYFVQLDDQIKKDFWTYQFLVEYVPTTDQVTLNNVFERINKNVARLTRQELRHAKFGGRFAQTTDEMAQLLETGLPADVPHFVTTSKWQMKDVEFVAQLLLLVENGPATFSQDDLDQAYSDRDSEWEDETKVRSLFTRIIHYLNDVFSSTSLAAAMPHARRLRNQADFYSVFGAVLQLNADSKLPSVDDTARRLASFIQKVQDEPTRLEKEDVRRYFEAARSASNDLRQRRTRVEVLAEAITTE